MEKKEHKYAQVLRWIADGEHVQVWNPLERKWIELNAEIISNAALLTGSYEFRIKPRTIMIGDVECEAPITSAKDGDVVYVLRLDGSDDNMYVFSLCNEALVMFLKSGFLYSSSEAATKAVKALVKLLTVGSKMNQQSEALRLADVIEKQHLPSHIDNLIAAELRRQHARISELEQQLFTESAMREQLEQQLQAKCLVQISEPKDFKSRVYEALGISKLAEEFDVFVNIENLCRRVACLDAIEREFFAVETPPDESEGGTEPGKDCLLNWGATPEQYVKQFEEASEAIQANTVVRTALSIEEIMSIYEEHGHNSIEFTRAVEAAHGITQEEQG